MDVKELAAQMRAEADAADLKVRQAEAQIKQAMEDKEYWERQAQAARTVFLRLDISCQLAANSGGA